MSGIKFKMTLPNPNLEWWKSSKSELNKLVEEHHQDSWTAGKDPVTGAKWAPRKEPTGKHPLLRKSGKMLNTTKFKVDQHPMLFKATTNVAYGKFHQEGTGRMPQRRWLGIGQNFEDKFAKVLRKHIFKGTITLET